MMKRILIALACLTAWQAHAYTGFGICNFGKETVDKIICYGPTVLKATTILGDVKIAGSFKAFDVIMGPLTVAGAASVQNSTIKGDANITGDFQGSKVTIDRDLMVIGNRASLEHSNVKGAISITSTAAKPQLVLTCGTTVKGSVVFTRQEGVIQITDDSLIEGGVKNGQMEFIKKAC
jgi:hypothetical protein